MSGGGHVFARGSGLPRVARASGCQVWDAEGRRYLDGAGGAIVVGIGHGVASVAEAIAEQAARVAYAHGTAFTSEALEAYAAELAALVPVDGDRTILDIEGEPLDLDVEVNDLPLSSTFTLSQPNAPTAAHSES